MKKDSAKLIKDAILFVPYSYAATVFYGLVFGVPIAIQIFDLTIETEVGELFVVTAVLYSFILLPILFFASLFFSIIVRQHNMYRRVLYVLAVPALISAIFYGISISMYYK